MKYSWIDAYCLAKRGTTKDFKEEWHATRYFIGGKMFALLGADNTARPIITLKSYSILFNSLTKKAQKEIME